MTDFLEDALQHSWGKSPKQKAAEKRYNKEYYQRNKDKWKRYRENAKKNVDVQDKNVEGEQMRYDAANKDYTTAKYKYDKLRGMYQNALATAKEIGNSDPSTKTRLASFQKELEQAASDMDTAEKNLKAAEERLNAAKAQRDRTKANIDKTLKNDPFAKRASKRMGATAANEAAKAARQDVRGTKARREKSRANAYAENMAAQQQASQDKNSAFKEKQQKEYQRLSGELQNASNKRAVIKRELDNAAKELKALEGKYHKERDRYILAEKMKKETAKLQTMNDKIKEIKADMAKIK